MYIHVYKYPESLMQREYLHPGVSIMSLDKGFRIEDK